MTLQLVDRWTTQDGSWDVDISKPYGIDLLHAVNYVNEDIPGKGGATHIFVKAPVGTNVAFYTRSSNGTPENENQLQVGPTGWVNHPMFHSSAYVPSRDERGPWYVSVNDFQMPGMSGIGLPDGLHVSTFLVVENRIEMPTPQPEKGQYQVLKNGTVVATWES